MPDVPDRPDRASAPAMPAVPGRAPDRAAEAHTARPHIAAARRLFPRGLRQPAGGYRAGADALLLADFVGQTCPSHPFTFVELGVGNGMAACALALGAAQAQGVGVDNYLPAVTAAQENVRRLGLDDRLCVLAGDVTTVFAAGLPAALGAVGALPDGTEGGTPDEMGVGAGASVVPPLLQGAQQVDVVLTNPPYRAAGVGRRCRADGREHALVEQGAGAAGTLAVFCRAAARLLRPHGRLYCIYAAARLPYLLRCLHAQHFGLRRLCAVYTRPHTAARFVLAEGRLHCADDVRLTSLQLYEAQSSAIPDN